MDLLNNINTLKLMGYAHYCVGNYKKAIKFFDKSLEIKDDGQCLELLSYCYVYLKQYEVAMEYAIKAIENGRDCYGHFLKIAAGNLLNPDLAENVLLNGCKNHSPEAAVHLANLYSDYYSFPWEYKSDYDEAATLYEKAYEWSKDSLKGHYALNAYEGISRIALRYKDYASKALSYLKIADAYGIYNRHATREILRVYDFFMPYDDELIEMLIDRMDGYALLVLGLLLYEKEDAKNESYYLFAGGWKKGNNTCAYLVSLMQPKYILPNKSYKNLESLRNNYITTDIYVPNLLKPIYDLILKDNPPKNLH